MTTASAIAAPATGFDVDRVRTNFPALFQQVHGKPLVYLDSAATALKPQSVINTLVDVYAHDSANIHRGVHLLSQRATMRYEQTREKVRAFLHAAHVTEVVYTRGTTDSINLVAQSWVRQQLQAGDEIILTGLEHHSNIVPWQMVAEHNGARLVVVPITDAGEVTLDAFEEKLTDRTQFVAVAHVSNALGTVLPVKEIVQLAHQRGAKVLIDGAQAVAHMPVDVQDLDCDFYVFSGHKLYGPNGIGILYGKESLLDTMPPYQGGGDMIRSVTFAKTTYNDLPYKFEAGTPHIAGVIGLGAAIDYFAGLDSVAVCVHESALLDYGTEALRSVPGLRLIGTAPEKAGVLSFVMDVAHPHDIGTIVDGHGVAIRTGHHCAQPVMDRFGVAATARASLGIYNTRQDIDSLVVALHHVQEILG